MKEVSNNLKSYIKKLKIENKQLHYDLLKKIFSDPKLFQKLSKLNNELVTEVIHLYSYGYLSNEDKSKILEMINHIIGHLQEKFNESLEYEINQLIDFLNHEVEYLNYTPSGKSSEYIKLVDLLQSENKILLVDKAYAKIINEKLYYEDREVQGIKIEKHLFHYNISMTVNHYTSEKVLKDIFNEGEIEPGNDSYCYFVETGRLDGQNINSIKKIIGAKDAEGSIKVKIIINLKRVWARFKRNKPILFAIEASKIPIEPPKKQKGFEVKINGEIDYW